MNFSKKFFNAYRRLRPPPFHWSPSGGSAYSVPVPWCSLSASLIPLSFRLSPHFSPTTPICLLCLSALLPSPPISSSFPLPFPAQTSVAFVSSLMPCPSSLCSLSQLLVLIFLPSPSLSVGPSVFNGFHLSALLQTSQSMLPEVRTDLCLLKLVMLNSIWRVFAYRGFKWEIMGLIICGGIVKRSGNLESCEGVGDNSSFSVFIKSSETLQEVELRTCRTVVEGVLLKFAENCGCLNSLSVYDGGNKEGLLQFIRGGRCNVEKLDLRLPLDLDNDHLIAISQNFRYLPILKLQSCGLVTGEGLQAIGRGVGHELQELALINCDVVERESGLLTLLGQNLKRLKKLDLSYNEMLLDKELSSMLVSCNHLNEIKLRGCSRLTGETMVSMCRNCQLLETVDIMYCSRIELEVVECFLWHSLHLRLLLVEDYKLSVIARNSASDEGIEVVDK